MLSSAHSFPNCLVTRLLSGRHKLMFLLTLKIILLQKSVAECKINFLYESNQNGDLFQCASDADLEE